MRIISSLLKASLLSIGLSLTSVQADTSVFDTSNFELTLPSVAIMSNGQVQGYISLQLQTLSNNQGYIMLDNAYATGIAGEINGIANTDNPAATYDSDTQKLTIPALAFDKTDNAPTTALTLNVLANLDGVFILGL